MTLNTELDERINIALKVARQHHLSIWDTAFQEHRRHPTFRMAGYPHTLEYSFLCSCSGVEQEWRINIATLKSMLPEARDVVQRLFRHHSKTGQKKLKRQLRKAEVRARSLLHQHLTREQRLELRKTKGFTIQGKDGRLYHLAAAQNITLEHEGMKYSLCVHPKDVLPTSDVLLAQKIMLEADPETLIHIANIRNLTTGESIESGSFVLGEELKVKSWRRTELLDFTEEQLEDPREWIETRCRDATIQEQPKVVTEDEQQLESSQEQIETRCRD